MSSEAGKGSKRRPGIVPPTAWERIFNPEMCSVCGDAKWKCGCAEVKKEDKEKAHE